MKPLIVPALLPALVWLLLSPVCAASFDSIPQYGIRLWQTDSGLPHNAVTAICQTPDDYLWVGTSRGLARFDGAYFKVIRNDSVTALLVSRQGVLWMGTATNGVAELRDGKFVAHTLPGGSEANQVKALCEGIDGALWIGTMGGLYRFRDGQFVSVDPLKTPVLTLCGTGEDLWIGSRAGLNSWRKEVLGALQLDRTRNPVPAICCSKRGELWIATGEWLISRKDNHNTIFNRKNGLSGTVHALHEDRQGTLWIGTSNGLYRMDGGRIVPRLDEAEKSFDAILCMEEDQEGNLWLGTAEGLVQLRPKPFQAISRDEGLTHGNVTSLLEDEQRNLWIATSGGGLNCLSPDGKITAFNRNNSEVGDSVLALGLRTEGGLWLGDEQRLLRFHRGLSVNYAAALGLKDSEVRVLRQDSTGKLWVGAGEALYCYEKGSGIRYTHADGLAGRKVRTILEDHTGGLWFGTESGLTSWKQNTFSRFTTSNGLSTNSILALYEDRAFNLWIGTEGGGLNRYRDGKFTAYTAKNGLPTDTVLEVLEDNIGNLWLSGPSGIFQVRKSGLDDFDRGATRNLPCISFGKSDGLPSLQGSGSAKPGAWKSKDGRLWFATSRGVATIDPAKLQQKPAAPRIVIEEMVADGRSVEMDSLDSTSPTIDIPAGRGELKFRFAALSFQAPEKNHFAYKLEGVDPDWVNAGTRDAAYYNNIKPGHYVFRVAGRTSELAGNSPDSSISLTLQPHYWQTWWFKFVSVMASLSLAAAGARYVTRRRMQTRLLQLEHQHDIERERARIARDMHDDLGARLTEIRMLSNLTLQSKAQPAAVEAQSRRVSDAAGELIDNLHSIVWAVNPANDSLEKLADYIRGFAQPFLKSSSIRCRFECPTHLPDWPLSSEIRHNIFLVVKEALNNTVKHGQASEVRIALSAGESKLVLSIADNGKGFPMETSTASGNGLQNMEKRIKNIGGTFQLRSEPGKGTQVQLEVPLQR